ncbi:MAG: TetR/AcrR family transcriptional regulator [Streptosporangiales bacterium]|nr:TetR/AcrR family transcriptional regulator [Streptosporangiales bacterium]
MTRAAAPKSAALDDGSPDGRSTRWDDHNADRRERILAAAIELVQQSGGDVAVRDIAERAGVPRSVVYRIFRDRDDLDEQLRTEIIGRLMRVLSPVLEPHGTIREAIDIAATTYVSWVSENPLLHQFLGFSPAKRTAPGSRVVSGTRIAVSRRLQALIEAGVTRAGGDPAIAEPLAFGVVGLVDGAVNRWVHRADGAFSAEQLSEFLAESIWVMLTTHGAHQGIVLTADTRASDLF